MPLPFKHVSHSATAFHYLHACSRCECLTRSVQVGLGLNSLREIIARPLQRLRQPEVERVELDPGRDYDVRVFDKQSIQFL
jgi:hypothetical protein